MSSGADGTKSTARKYIRLAIDVLRLLACFDTISLTLDWASLRRGSVGFALKL